jgi:predicted Zn finger-like uncharacterized protein
MRIICEKCNTKYSAPDEKVRGKTFKIRCRKCQEIIIIRGTQVPAEEPKIEEIKWHLVLDGAQKGPFTLKEIKNLYSEGKINFDTYAWRSGFSNWMYIKDIQELNQHLKKPQDLPKTTMASKSVVSADTHKTPSQEAPRKEVITSKEERPFSEPKEEPKSQPLSDIIKGGAATRDISSPSVLKKSERESVDLFAEEKRQEEVMSGGISTSEPPSEEKEVMKEEKSPWLNISSMTGVRSENSVLFSLANLRDLAAKPSQPTPETKAEAKDVSESSGLIDIRQMTQEIAAPAQKSKEEDFLSLGGGGGSPFASGLGGPLLMPTAKAESNKFLYISIGVGGFLVLTLIVLIVILATREEPKPQIIYKPAPGTLAMQQKTPGPQPWEPSKKIQAEEEKQVKATTKRRRRRRRAKAGSEVEGIAKTPSDLEAATTSQKPKDELDRLLESAIGGRKKKRGVTSPSPSSTSVPSEGQLPYSLTRAQVHAGMRSISSKVRACYTKYGQSGTAIVTVVISNTGRVSKATVSGNFAGTPTGACVAQAVRSASFPRFTKSSLTVRYPFFLR